MKDKIISIDQGGGKKTERLQVWTEDANGKKQYTELDLTEESQTSATCAFSKACVMRGPRWTDPLTGKAYCLPHSRDLRASLETLARLRGDDQDPRKSMHWSKKLLTKGTDE